MKIENKNIFLLNFTNLVQKSHCAPLLIRVETCFVRFYFWLKFDMNENDVRVVLTSFKWFSSELIAMNENVVFIDKTLSTFPVIKTRLDKKKHFPMTSLQYTLRTHTHTHIQRHSQRWKDKETDTYVHTRTVFLNLLDSNSPGFGQVFKLRSRQRNLPASCFCNVSMYVFAP